MIVGATRGRPGGRRDAVAHCTASAPERRCCMQHRPRPPAAPAASRTGCPRRRPARMTPYEHAGGALEAQGSAPLPSLLLQSLPAPKTMVSFFAQKIRIYSKSRPGEARDETGRTTVAGRAEQLKLTVGRCAQQIVAESATLGRAAW